MPKACHSHDKRTKKFLFLKGLGLHGLILFCFLSLGVFLYAPPVGWQHDLYFGQGWDPWIYIWFLHWAPFALSHNLPLFYTDYVAAPVGESLAWRTGMPSFTLSLAPLTTAFGGVAVYNCLMLSAPGLAAWGAYLAAYQLTSRLAPSVVAGLIFGYSSYELAQLLSHLNLAFVAAVPLALWICLRATANAWTPLRLGLSLGVLLAFEFGVAQEVFATTIVFGAALLATLIAQRRPGVMDILPGVALAIAVCVLLTAPITWQMIIWYKSGADSVSSPISLSNDVLDFIIPTPVTLAGGRLFAPFARNRDIAEQGAYFGLPLLAVLIHIWRTHRSMPAIRLAGLMALLAGLLSLGPYVHVLGVAVSTAPWLLVSNLPFLKAMLPARFIMYAWLAVAMMIALWLAAPGPASRRYLAVACCVLAIAPDRNVARRWTPVSIPEIFAASSDKPTIPRDSRILILPEQGEAISYQVMSGMDFRLVGQGYLGNGQPRPFSRWHLYQSLFDNDFAHIDIPEFSAYLAAYGVDYVVVVQALPPLAGDAATTLLQAAGWEVATATPQATIFRPGPTAAPPPTAAEINAFMNMPSPVRVAKTIRSETDWVCTIRKIAGFVHLDAAPLLHQYEAYAHPPLPVADLICGRS